MKLRNNTNVRFTLDIEGQKTLDIIKENENVFKDLCNSWDEDGSSMHESDLHKSTRLLANNLDKLYDYISDLVEIYKHIFNLVDRHESEVDSVLLVYSIIIEGALCYEFLGTRSNKIENIDCILLDYNNYRITNDTKVRFKFDNNINNLAKITTNISNREDYKKYISYIYDFLEGNVVECTLGEYRVLFRGLEIDMYTEDGLEIIEGE